MNQENMINIGKITSSVGIKGEVRVTLYAGESDNLVKGAVLTLTAGKAKLVYEVQSVRYQGGRPVVKFAEVPDRTAADTLRNYEIYIPEESLAELGEGEFYIKDLMGFAVYDRAGDAVIGKVSDYIRNTAQCLFEVETEDGRSILIPDVDAFVKNIDGEKKTVEVELIPGFLD